MGEGTGDGERPRAQQIRDFLLQQTREHPTDLIAFAAEHFGVSRQGIRKQILRLVQSGQLSTEGNTKGRRYSLAERRERQTYEVAGLEEHKVWDEFVAPQVADCSKSVRDICAYGVTEMVNNVIDHSGAERAVVVIATSALDVSIDIQDFGIGIFEKIRQEFDLEDIRLAVFELSKGKLTTDPTRHSGEGIFFTSRMFDEFSILSGPLFLSHQRAGFDWLLDDRIDRQIGTRITMKISRMATHTDTEIFQQYATEHDDYAFNKTHVVLELAQIGEERFVSRSQAKRVMNRLDRFKEIGLDFAGIESIGPAFADEIFRVFVAAHPDIRVWAYNANTEVERMIARAQQHGADELDRV